MTRAPNWPCSAGSSRSARSRRKPSGRAGAEDLAGFEEYAAGLIEGLLPEQMGETELSTLIDNVIAETGAASARDMGKVMAAVMVQGGARVDGKVASRLVKERLSA